MLWESAEHVVLEVPWVIAQSERFLSEAPREVIDYEQKRREQVIQVNEAIRRCFRGGLGRSENIEVLGESVIEEGDRIAEQLIDYLIERLDYEPGERHWNYTETDENPDF